MARPSKYNEELQQKFDDLVDNLYPMGTTKEDEKAAYNNFWLYGIVEQIALYLSINIDTIYDWSDPDSERYHEAFSETLKTWHIITKGLLHRLSPKIAERSPALAIFLRKTKLGELEISKTILEQRLTTRSEKNLYIKITGELNDAEALGVDKKEIDEVRGMLEEMRRDGKMIEGKGESDNGAEESNP